MFCLFIDGICSLVGCTRLPYAYTLEFSTSFPNCKFPTNTSNWHFTTSKLLFFRSLNVVIFILQALISRLIKQLETDVSWLWQTSIHFTVCLLQQPYCIASPWISSISSTPRWISGASSFNNLHLIQVSTHWTFIYIISNLQIQLTF